MSTNTESILLIMAGSCSPSVTTKERKLHKFSVRPLGTGPTVFRSVMVSTECQLEKALDSHPLGMC